MIDSDQPPSPALQPSSGGLKALPAYLAAGAGWAGWELVFHELQAW